jgi:pyruvate/2-oxoglutarate dehydrogenase complex dihydrolipoamide dehydrogenase (E3) component
MELAGGDCLNAGCVPSKALLRCAKLVREARKAASKDNEFGVCLTQKDGKKLDVEVHVDFPRVMERMRRLRSSIAPVDGHARGNSIGSAVFQGKGVFTSPFTIEVVEYGKKLGDANNPVLRFRKAVIATGGRPSIPDVLGLAEAPYTTNLNLFNLQSLPERMVVLGAGIVALEMAQAFAAFGSKVTVLQRSRLLSGDEEAGKVIRQTLEQDGVTFLDEVTLKEVNTLRPRGDNGELPLMSVSITHKQSSKPISLECECLLVAIGRTANVQNMGLETANVNFHPTQGVLINDYAQSISNPNVYAVGDCVANVPRLTHMSGEMAKVVVQNSLFRGEWKMSSLVVPAVMYTEPEYAVVKQVVTLDANGHVVPTPKQSSEEFDIYRTELRSNDRAILDSSDTNSYVKISCVKDTGTIVGCTIVSSRAGEMINEVSLAIKNGIDIQGLGRNIHSYPTLGEGVMGCGLQFIGARWEKLNS